jgi:outer membrane protein assembly factor BamB
MRPRLALKLTSLLSFVALLFPAPPIHAADQPQWGQAWSRNLVAPESPLPQSFDPASGRNIRWSAPLGTETYATPVIARGRVLIGTNNGRPRDPRHTGDRSILLCLDELTGNLLWQLVLPKLTNSIYWDWPRAGICSPPTVVDNRVYLVSNRGEVLCLDLDGMANGNDGPFRDEAHHCVPAGDPPIEPGPNDADILWIFDIVNECHVRQHDQAHASPLVLGPFLYVNTSNGVDDSHKVIDAPNAPSLIALDRATGRLVAQDAEHIGPRIFHCTWSSPALAEINDQVDIIFCGGDGIVYAFQPLPTNAPPSSPAPATPPSLKCRWRFDPDPTAPKEEVHRFNSNREISPSNIKSMPVVHANRLFITGGGDLWWGKHQAWLQCINLALPNTASTNRLLWSYPLLRHCMATPALYDGLAYVGDCGRRIHCIDITTGQPAWTHDVRDEIWASPLIADGKAFFASRRGEFLAFAASRQKNLLATTLLGEAICGTPVAANRTLYVTTMSRLYAVRSP